MANQTVATIQIGQHAISVQCFADTHARDHQVRDLAATTDPIAVAEWPLDPTSIADRATALLAAKGGRIERRDDCLWAIKTATIGVCPTHYWLETRTPEQREAIQHAGRRAVLRGDVS